MIQKCVRGDVLRIVSGFFSILFVLLTQEKNIFYKIKKSIHVIFYNTYLKFLKTYAYFKKFFGSY